MSSPKTDIVEVTCNWKVSNGKELKSGISIVDPTKEVDFDDLVSLESCISLSREGLDHADLLEMTFKVLTEGVSISNLFIVSEARLLEVYGRCGEYQDTTKAEDSEAGDDEMKVYNARLKLATPSPECAVKFAGLGAGKQDMWVLGVGVALKLSPASSATNMAARVDQLLQGSSVPLSASAEHCKRLVMAQAAAQQIPSPMDTSVIKHYVDSCCDQLENRLKLHIDERFDALQSSLNDKFDLISSSLSKQ